MGLSAIMTFTVLVTFALPLSTRSIAFSARCMATVATAQASHYGKLKKIAIEGNIGARFRTSLSGSTVFFLIECNCLAF